MRILRLAPAVLISALAAGAPPSAGPGDGPRAGSCKPDGPVRVRLLPSGPPPGARVAVEAELQPLLGLRELAWRWELSPGVQLLDGEAHGAGAPERGAVTRVGAELAAPAGSGRARLLVVARFIGHDAGGEPVDEQATVVRTLEWGEPGPDAGRVLTADPEGGGLVEVVALPVAHRAGR